MADETIPPNDTPPPNTAAAAGNGDAREPLKIEDELKDSYLNYAMSVLISRALPDVRDGLKPSQRRILLAMHDMNLGPASTTSKCAGIIGETMKRYHPHGDQSIYGTLVRLAQDWNMRHTLIHPQGNFGSIAGLPPAAHRYTEARLTPIGAEMLADLERDTVDFTDNYDGKYREPLVLPSKFPNLLVNGSDGIAVGMATEIPPHNLREVCDAVIRLIDEPDVSIDALMKIIPGPDFPTGGIICGRQGIVDGYYTGRGKISLRARATISEDEDQIVIEEVPYQQTRNRLMEAMGELVKEERIKGVKDIRDESSQRQGVPVRLVVYLKRDADAQLVLNQLYQFSPLQRTVSLIMLALVDGRPRTLTIKQMLEEFLRHRVQVIRRRTEYLLREAKRRGHILEGQLIAISSMDEVIAVCRSSPSRSAAKERLQNMDVAAAVMERALGADHFAALRRELGEHSNYHMTEAQAEAIVRMQLGQLAALERDEILREYQELRGLIRGYEDLLSSEQNVLGVIRADTQAMRDKYGDERKTMIIEDDIRSVHLEDLIAEELNAVTISHNGYIKRLPLTTYRAQHRGGKGVSGGQAREDDFVEHFFVSSTHSFLLCFTNKGQLYWLKVLEIPQMSRTSAGRNIANLLSLREDEKISSIIPVRRFDGDSSYLMMATRKGLVKKTALDDYSRPRAGGIIGIALEEGDTLIGVVRTNPGDEILLATRQGMAIRFDEAQARVTGRNTRGVKGIGLVEGDEVVGVVVADPEGALLTLCEKGYGKRTPFGANTAGVEEAPETEAEEPLPPEPIEEAAGEEEGTRDRSSMRYRKQRRGGKGLRDIRTSDRNGPVVGVLSVHDGDDIMVITIGGMVNRTHVSEIRIVGRNTQGVRIMNLDENDKIASVAKIAREDIVEQPDEAVEPGPAEAGPAEPPPVPPPA